MITKDFYNKFLRTVDREGQELIQEFFITFSRLENALISTISYAEDKGSWVEADSGRYISDISSMFDISRTDELANAAGFLLENPPKVQIIDGVRLSWEERRVTESDILTRLFVYVKVIRNNLFHGGKFHGAFQPDVSRNYELLNAALIVLNEIISLDEDVRNNFIADF